MDAVEAGGQKLAMLNHYAGFDAAQAGGIKDLVLSGKELGVALARYLPRSAGTLATLNLRRVPWSVYGGNLGEGALEQNEGRSI
jgi:hypothetical protein